MRGVVPLIISVTCNFIDVYLCNENSKVLGRGAKKGLWWGISGLTQFVG